MATKPPAPLSILDPRFKYRNSASTDVRRTWRRARLMQRLAEKKASPSVVPMKKRGASC